MWHDWVKPRRFSLSKSFLRVRVKLNHALREDSRDHGYVAYHWVEVKDCSR